MTEKYAKFIFKKILLGVQALHGAGYCHRDLKLENILLDQNFNPKITNFSFMTQTIQNNQTILLNNSAGTFSFSSPQVLEHKPYNGEKADIFSLGVILFSLVTGHCGFRKAGKDDKYYKHILNGDIEKYWNSLPENIKNALIFYFDFQFF